MTDLTQALAELRQMELTYGQLWTAREVMQTQNADNCKSIATVLNAALSGTMLPRADADLALAMMVEKAASTGYRICAETRHVTLGRQVEDTIRALAPASALSELQELRADRDRLDAATNTLSEMWEGEKARAEAAEADITTYQQIVADMTQEAELAALRAQVERLTGALRFYADFHENPNDGPWGINSQDFGKEARAALKNRDG